MGKVSYNPDDFIEGGGGLLDDVDVKIIECIFDRDCTYGGKISDPVLAMQLTMEILNPTEEHADDPTHVEYMSAGNRDFFEVIDNGHDLDPLGSQTTLRKSTKAAQFLTSVIQSGFDVTQLDNIGGLEGAVLHLSRQEVGKGAFGGTHDDQGRAKTILLCDKVYTAKEATALATGTGVTVAGPAVEATPSTGTSDPTEIIMGILKTAETMSIEVPDLYQAMFAAMQNDPNRNAVIKSVGANDNAFLKDGPWKFDGTVVSL